jgi:glycosyltransferase involved in cell wall biosynthesis
VAGAKEIFLNMRVLLVTGSYPPMKCGVGAYTQRLAVALADCETTNVVVLTDMRASDFAEHEGVEVLPLIRSWRLGNIIRIARIVMRIKPDVVHFQYPTQGYNGRAAILLPALLRFLGVSCVQTWHEPMVGRSSLFLRWGLDALVSVRKDLIPWMSCSIKELQRHTKLVHIPAASLLPTIRLNDEDRSRIRTEYVEANEFLLSFYGFVAPLKGIETLFEVVARTNSKLLMACDFQRDDEYHSALLKMMRSMGIESRVRILGFLHDEQLVEILTASDAAVFPFRDGAAPWNTSIDGATVQGVFVLTTSLLKSGYYSKKNIYYAKPGNSDEMIAAIQKYAGVRSPQRESNLEWKCIADRHTEVYRELLA